MIPDKIKSAPVCGPDGCEVTAASTDLAPGAPRPTAWSMIDLLVISDTICPWCYVAKRHMEAALAQLASDGITMRARWLPFELNPDMPKDGLDRKEYRSAKFGSWAKSKELDAQVAAAGKAVGLDFRHDLIQRTPNTFDSHRLIWFAGRNGVQDGVVEGLFKAYFTDGCDIGQADVLVDVAAAAGIDRAAARAYIAGSEGAMEVRQEIERGRRRGLNGVPTFVLNNGVLFSGAQPADVMAVVLLTALRKEPGGKDVPSH